MMRLETPIDITMMICTNWNNPVRLGLTLAAFGNCRIPAGITWEILVVNNDGSETTDGVVARHRGTLPIVLAHEPLAGLSRARNRGLRTARGKLIVFTDDDVTVDGGWLDASLGGLRCQVRLLPGRSDQEPVRRTAPRSPRAPVRATLGQGAGLWPRPSHPRGGRVFHRPELGMSPGAAGRCGVGRRIERAGRGQQARARGRGNRSHEAVAGGRRLRRLSARRAARSPCAGGENHADACRTAGQAAAYRTGAWMRRRKRRARRCWGIHAGAFADSSKP